MSEYVNIVDRLSEGVSLPDGFDRWGVKTVDALRRTSNGFHWPPPGGSVSSWDDGPHGPGECPERKGDGLTVAKTFAAMSSGGLSVHAILLVAYRQADVVGETEDKARTRGDVSVVQEWLVRDANLYGADLRGADLRGANLRGANLCDANLSGAGLCGAILYGADLCGASLYGADLYGANLRGADLSDANLYGANLYGADLCDADLSGADLYEANLRGADLSGADLSGADLYGANLSGADLCDAVGYVAP